MTAHHVTGCHIKFRSAVGKGDHTANIGGICFIVGATVKAAAVDVHLGTCRSVDHTTGCAMLIFLAGKCIGSAVDIQIAGTLAIDHTAGPAVTALAGDLACAVEIKQRQACAGLQHKAAVTAGDIQTVQIDDHICVSHNVQTGCTGFAQVIVTGLADVCITRCGIGLPCDLLRVLRVIAVGAVAAFRAGSCRLAAECTVRFFA